MSTILDHTQLFAALALNDLLRRLGLPRSRFTRLHVWADCGAHFRGYCFLWSLIELCQIHKLSEVVLHFYAEHHGKGRCDGQFGLQRHWRDTWAEAHVISSVQQYVSACQSGADDTMADDPPPAGPSYKCVLFSPPKPSEAKAFDNSVPKFQIEYTYCVAIRPKSGA
eukprot:8284755-Heterocapsa_arctica.AAC.1